jgi:hypothetical protein
MWGNHFGEILSGNAPCAPGGGLILPMAARTVPGLRSSHGFGPMPAPFDVINVMSTKRSGHHAFIAWIMEHAPGTYLAVNNVHPSPAFLVGYEQRIREAGPAKLILNYEGVSRSGVDAVRTAQKRLGQAALDIVFLRDPANLLASLLAHKKRPAQEIVMIARQLFAEKTWLDERAAKGGAQTRDITHVSYTSWLMDDAYRRRLADYLGLAGSDPYAKVPSHGGGSSFGDLDTVSAEDRRALLTRWRGLQDDTLFRALLSHKAFRTTFETALSGATRDSFGGALADPEALAFVRSIPQDRPAPFLIDRTIGALARRADIFQAIEISSPLVKKAHILRATAAALFGGGPPGSDP